MKLSVIFCFQGSLCSFLFLFSKFPDLHLMLMQYVIQLCHNIRQTREQKIIIDTKIIRAQSRFFTMTDLDQAVISKQAPTNSILIIFPSALGPTSPLSVVSLLSIHFLPENSLNSFQHSSPNTIIT